MLECDLAAVQTLSQLIRGIEDTHKQFRVPYPKVNFRFKVKLEGPFVALCVSADGTVTTRVDGREVTSEDDASGFAAWVASEPDWVNSVLRDHTLYGWWYGHGSGRSALLQNVFAITAVQGRDGSLWVDPFTIETKVLQCKRVHILPWEGCMHVVYFEDSNWVGAFASAARDTSAAYVECNPWVQREFLRNEPCAGLVWYPYSWNGCRADVVVGMTFQVSALMEP